MLRTRVLTVLLLLPLAWWVVLVAEGSIFSYAVAALMTVGAWEFHRLAALQTAAGGWFMVTLQTAILAVLMATRSQWIDSMQVLMATACVLWVMLFSQMLRFQPGRTPDKGWVVLSVLRGILVLSVAWMALSWLRDEPAGQWWIVLLLLTIWSADIGAYFTGRAIGGPKMAPAISPGKTISGLLGGLVMAAIVAVVAAHFIPALTPSLPAVAALAVATVLASVGGDLFISMHKRTVGIKDTGRLFPGHGGVLDRFDSLLAGAPFFALGKILLGL